MKNYFLVIIFLLISFFFWPYLFAKTEAASFGFDKSSYSVRVGETVQVAVTIDAGTDELLSADAYVLYDAAILSVDSITDGSYFPTVAKNTATAGKVYIAGMVDDPATSKKGVGTLATITFKGLKDGTVNLTFDCNLSKIIKNDIHATNVLECGRNGQATLTVGAGGSSTGSSTDSSTGSSTDSSTDSSTSGSSAPSTLPKSGIFENVVKLAVPGIILFLFGVISRRML